LNIIIKEQVQTNKDLDLPTQQELLAQFRCDEIATAALADFNEQAKSQKRPVESGQVVDGLGALMRNWWTQALGTPLFRNFLSTNIFQFDTTATHLDTTKECTNGSAPISSV
jgi:hypothetical protein